MAGNGQPATRVSVVPATGTSPLRLAAVSPALQAILDGTSGARVSYPPHDIRRDMVWVTMRDGVRLATDLYFPPLEQAPAIAVRTPYGREALHDVYTALARGGYIVVSQDCRGTGDSEPDHWDFYIYEREDSLDFVTWVTDQPWYTGFLGSIGGSYLGGTQFCMAMHPSMTAVAPEVAGLGVAVKTGARFHLFVNAYARTVGKGDDKVPIDRLEMERQILAETLATGYFNDPLSRAFPGGLVERYPELTGLTPTQSRAWLWERYCACNSDERAAMIRLALGLGAQPLTILDIERLDSVFPHCVHADAHMLPSTDAEKLCQSICARAFMITGWYDWCLDDALRTWEQLAAHAPDPVQARSRLLITPSAHNSPGYHEGRESHPELDRTYGADPALLLQWYDAVRDGTVEALPAVTYYLMGANEWCVASAWPPPESAARELFLGPAGTLTWDSAPDWSEPDRYTYDPEDPTPTLVGSILSSVYPPGSIDVTDLQVRSDVLTFTTAVLESHLDVVGPLKLILYASSSAVDTDFVARLSDVFPDDRAIQLQTGIVRARFRDKDAEPSLLEPGRIYCLEIGMAGTANRFAAGHRLRVDISSADFPKFERNANRGGEPGPPVRASQTVFHGSAYPSRLVVSVITDTQAP